MLAKKNRIKSRTDMDLVFKMGKSYRSGFLSVKYLPKNGQKSRFAVSIGTKISTSSVKRNQLRRVMVEHLRKYWLNKAKKGDFLVYFNRKLNEKEINDKQMILANLNLVLNKCLK
jgi:ribonuclease P protein component